MTDDTFTFTDDEDEAPAAPPPHLCWHVLPYLDGPLARRTALFGRFADEEIPERLTATVGTVDWPTPTPGRPVRYELAAAGYRFTGEGYWPGDEPQEEPPLDDELPDDDPAAVDEPPF